MSGTRKPLPRPTVGDPASGDVRAMLCNPIYAGLASYPRIVDDETWVRAAAKAVKEEGAEQFFVNMLYVLRGSLGSVEVSGSKH